MNFLEGLHLHIDQRIAWKTARQVGADVWEWPPVEEALEAAVLCTMQEYVRRRQANIE